MATSTTLLRMKSRAMPMACVAVEQALQVAKVGPLTPNSMPTWALADEPMMRSSVSGCVARLPSMNSAR